MKILLQIVSLFNCVLNGLVFIQIFSFLFFWKSLKTFQFRIIRILFPDRTTVEQTIDHSHDKNALLFILSLSLCHEVISIMKLFDEK